MNQKERILDFIIFVLTDYEELLNNVTCFFKQNHSVRIEESPFDRTNKITEDYKVFIKEKTEPLPTELFVNDKQIGELNSLSDLLENESEKVLLGYLNDNYSHGFPDDVGEDGMAHGGNDSLDIELEDLRNYFDYYLKFAKINKEVYISFFAQLLADFDLAGYEFDKEAENIEKLKNIYSDLEPKLKEEFMEMKKNQYAKKLFECYENSNFQTQVVFEDIGNKIFFLDFDQTLINQLNILPKDFNNYSTDFSYDKNLSITLASLEYLNYHFYGYKPKKVNYEEDEIKIIEKQLHEIKSKHSALINFLLDKGFVNREIDILFNLLNLNEFSALSIPYHNFSRQVSQFHILYGFYILDFFADGLDTIRDFEKMVDKISLYKIDSSEQFRKYYTNKESSKEHNNYPFKKYTDTLDVFEDELNINREKFKKVPDSFY